MNKNSVVIHIENLNKSYGNLQAVKDLSFQVSKSTCFGILGPNGAGKTSMMKTIYAKATKDKNKKTKVDIFGFDPAFDELEIKKISGIVPQDDNLDVELNVWQNLKIFSRFYGLSKKVSEKRIDNLLEFMELSSKKMARIRSLSGGMKRRLTIVRALLNNPKLLILDEPTTGLDPQVRHLIWNKLRELKNNGVTILLTTHYMEEAFQLCDEIIIMDKGQKILEGNPRKLLADNIEKYVLEIHNCTQKFNEELEKEIRLEIAHGITYLYCNSFVLLEKLTEKLVNCQYFLRQANLEDLFLKITGRSINDQQ